VAAFRKHAGAQDGADQEQSLADVRIDLPIDAHVPHDYVTGERLRLEVYRKIAEAVDDSTLAAIVEELTDRYGEPPTPVRNLLAVAAFRQTCRRLGVAEAAAQGSSIRFAPVVLADSAQLRLKRLYPRATYKPAAQAVIVPLPTADTGGRIGERAAALRDAELLDWCTKLLADLLMAAPVRPVVGAGTGSSGA